jgi:hypothetical protein
MTTEISFEIDRAFENDIEFILTRWDRGAGRQRTVTYEVEAYEIDEFGPECRFHQAFGAVNDGNAKGIFNDFIQKWPLGDFPGAIPRPLPRRTALSKDPYRTIPNYGRF